MSDGHSCLRNEKQIPLYMVTSQATAILLAQLIGTTGLQGGRG